MRLLSAILLTLVLMSEAMTTASAQDNKTKEEKRQNQFEETVKLIKTGNFIFEADRAFPQGGSSIDLTTNYGFLKVKEDSTAVGNLPFFGRAFSVDYGGNGGINFSGKMEDLDYSVNSKRNRISYSFKVKDGDYFQVSLDISYNGDASVHIISQNRSPIRYHGDIAKPVPTRNGHSHFEKSK